MDHVHAVSRDAEQLQTALSQVADLLSTATDGAELAALAPAVLDTLALWGIDSPALQVGFREAVRDRYRDLIQEQLIVGR